MQSSVNAENLWNGLVSSFGSDNINREPGDDKPIKVMVTALGDGDIQTLSNLLIYGNIRIKRSGKSLLIICQPKAY